MMKKILIIVSVAISALFGEISYPGLLAWSHAPTLAFAGGGRSVFSTDSDRLNPALLSYKQSRQFFASIIQYPAGIYYESITMIVPKGNKVRSFSVRHQSYGIFQGYDAESNPTGKYQSGETIVTGGTSHKIDNMPIRFGVSASLFYSQLGSYSSSGLFLNGGVLLEIPIIQGFVGLNMENVGYVLSRYTDTKENFPSQIGFSFSKKLAHLPLQFMIEAPYSIQSKETHYILAGEFQLVNGIQIRLGTSSNRIHQNIKQSVSQSALSGTGIGLGYSGKDYTIGMSTYFYGTGGWVYGVEFGGTF